MAARYDFREVPSKKENGEEPKLYPHIISSGIIRTRTILEEISEASTFTVGDLEGVLCALTEKISKYLVDGYHVELGKIGYFSASLKATHPVKDKKEIRAQSIYFDNINFRASMWFRRHTKGYVERAGKYGSRSSSQLSEEEKLFRLERYLNENAFITRSDYTRLTGRLKNKALEDLHRFVDQGIIEPKGRGSLLVFIKKSPSKEEI